MINFDEGYSFGIGAFETILVNNGKCVFLHAHLERLNKALEFFRINRIITEDDVKDYVFKNNIVNSAIKIIVSADNTIYMLRDNPYTDELYKRGFNIITSDVRANETSPLTYIKSLNYGINILEKRRVNSLGYDEVLFLNMKEEICECSTSNIFFVGNDKIVTPKRECGLLEGVVRRHIISQYNVEEKVIKINDIDSFSEAFITNSLMGIMPVSSINSCSFYQRRRTEQIMKEYFQMLNINLIY